MEMSTKESVIMVTKDMGQERWSTKMVELKKDYGTTTHFKEIRNKNDQLEK